MKFSDCEPVKPKLALCDVRDRRLNCFVYNT